MQWTSIWLVSVPRSPSAWKKTAPVPFGITERGIPVEMHKKGVSAARVVLSTLHAGGKFDNNAYKTSGGLHGVGSSVVNALSEHMTVKIYRDGCIYQDTLSSGTSYYRAGKWSPSNYRKKP